MRLLASHQLSQIDFIFSPFRSMVPGHSQALQLFLSFLSSSLRPLFVRLVNARSWFYFPFAGPPAHGMPHVWSAW